MINTNKHTAASGAGDVKRKTRAKHGSPLSVKTRYSGVNSPGYLVKGQILAADTERSSLSLVYVCSFWSALIKMNSKSLDILKSVDKKTLIFETKNGHYFVVEKKRAIKPLHLSLLCTLETE